MNPLQVPLQGPYREGGLFTVHFVYLSKTSTYGFPSKVALPQGPLHAIPHREMPHHYSLLHSSIKVPSIWVPPHIPGSPRMERGPHGERCPYPETLGELVFNKMKSMRTCPQISNNHSHATMQPALTCGTPLVINPKCWNAFYLPTNNTAGSPATAADKTRSLGQHAA